MGIRTHRVTKTKRRTRNEPTNRNDWRTFINTGGYQEFGEQYTALKFIVEECKGVFFRLEEWKDANGWVEILEG